MNTFVQFSVWLQLLPQLPAEQSHNCVARAQIAEQKTENSICFRRVFFGGGGNYATVFEVISPVFTMYFRFYLFYFTAECQREKRWADKGKREKVGGTRKIIRNIKGNLLCFFMFSFNSVVCKCSCACKRSSKFKKSTPTETTSWILNFVTCWHDFLLCACLYWQ